MWKLSPDQRLEKWKKFRNSLDDLTLEEALQQNADFWSSCPWVPFYLDEQNPNDWPDPWTLISENYYCELAKCLGMLYTVYLTKHTIDPAIECYKHHTGDLYILVVNEKYVLNMKSGEVVNRQYITKDYKLKFALNADKLRIHTYV